MAINVKDKLVTLESLGVAYSAEQDAREEADQALSTRIDNIVAPEGDPSLTEVSDARVSGSTTYNTLKARLDADKAAIGTEISQLSADLENTTTTIMVNATVDPSWRNGYIKPNNGSIGGDDKSCVTNYIRSEGDIFLLTVASGYRTKVALFSPTRSFIELLFPIGTGNRKFYVESGNYIIVQLSADSTIPCESVTNDIIKIEKTRFTDTANIKTAGKAADALEIQNIMRGIVSVDSGDYITECGYYGIADGVKGVSPAYARTKLKLSNFGGKTIFVTVGDGYKFALRMWNGSVYDPLKATDFLSGYNFFYIPDGYSIAFTFVNDGNTELNSADYDAISASFHIYTAAGNQFVDLVLGADVDFNDIINTGTYRAQSANMTSYSNCPTTEYGRLVVFNSASDGYSCVQIYVSYTNKVYTRILQVRDAGTWSTWEMLGDKGYLHDGEILRMSSAPESIPVGSEHLGYTAFMAATWEMLLPDGYTDGDSYNASTTKIINVHVSRESNWQSTAYGTNTDTYPIYRYTFTPINGYEKTVFLSAGCHGNEAEGYWGLYRLMKMIYFEGYKYPTLRNLRDNVRFIIVPCWNPWGMQNYRRYNAFESNNLQAYRWFYATDNTITVDGTNYPISDVGEAKVIWDTITNYSDVIDLWLEIHTDPYAGRTTSAGEIDDPRGYTQPYGCYGFVKNGSKTKSRLQGVMEDFYNIMSEEYSFTEKWHLVGINGDASGANGYSSWMASLSFPTALVEISTFMNGFPHASGSAGMMKLAQEYYGNCLAELLR